MKATPAMTTAQIETSIKSIATRGAKLDADIQKTGLAIMEHYAKSKDDTLANRLYHAMPKGSRRNALVEWFVTFGGMQVNKTAETKADRPLVGDKTKAIDITGAAGKPWYTCKMEKALDVEFDLARQLHIVLARAKRMQEEGKPVKTGGIDIARLESLLPPVEEVEVQATRAANNRKDTQQRKQAATEPKAAA
ncbi:hypothetical protein [Aeromonas sanarellii]|uniref:hypothetical protein n=1 Tax=Aeromonas sanarellii TaxID=633415 RepID=UPI003BA0F501